MKEIKRVLVIKFDDLVDFVASFAAMKQIRAAHPRARITLLTLPAFSGLGRASPYFDDIEQVSAVDVMAIARWIKSISFDRVYDLEGSGRTHALRRWSWPKGGAWSTCPRDHRRTLAERQAAQLHAAGLVSELAAQGGLAAPPDLAWMAKLAPPARTALKPKPYVVLVPGGAESRRWPACHYGAIAEAFRGQGFDVLILGRPEDSALARQIQRIDPHARDLTGRSDYAVIAGIAFRAALVIGNETELLHLVAAAGAPTLALFSGAVDPMTTAPRGHVAVLQAKDLAALSPQQVLRGANALAPEPAMAG